MTDQPLTERTLDAIESRAEAFENASMGNGVGAAYDSASDVPRLLAEVKRLRAEVITTQKFAERCCNERDQYRKWRDEACDKLEAAQDNDLNATFALADIANTAVAEREALAAKLAAGEASDGHHTHRELYEYRMLYNAAAAAGWAREGLPVVKSWRHDDGEPCFGGGWFIVVAELPTGQVSNHYPAADWGLFDVPAVDLPPVYDGHTPAEAAQRLRDYLKGTR